MDVAEVLLGWIPNWLGFCLIIAAGIAMIVVGAIQRSAGLICWGCAAIAGSIIAWVSGATSRPDINPMKKSFGGTVSRVPMKSWAAIFVLFVGALIVTAVTGRS